MDILTSRLRLVRPLEIAESHFLEVLINEFLLKRHSNGTGVELTVCFNDKSPAIWSRHAKYDIQKMVHDFPRRAFEHQARLDSFFFDAEATELSIADQSFPYRYASGGTLPIIRRAGKEYFCLFYRDIYPVGWNIANGACDNREELLNPLNAIERELGEELIILDPSKRERYVFQWDQGKRIDRPEFAVARRIWEEKFSNYNVSGFSEWGIGLKWLRGPDSLFVTDTSRTSKEGKNRIEGCYLNINAEDFGIEIDRVAKIEIGEGAILCDGEMTQGHLLDRIIGLFPIEIFTPEHVEKCAAFIPEMFFFNGEFYKNGNQFNEVLDRFIENLLSKGIRTSEEKEYYENNKKNNHQFNLCPVTRSLILRYLQVCAQAPRQKTPNASYDVFISFGSEDVHIARDVYGFLKNKGMRVFFSAESISTCDYHGEVDDAIQSAGFFVAVASNPQHLKKHWVDYEYKHFHILRMNQAPQKLKELYSFISFEGIELPPPLLVYQAVSFDPADIKPGLIRLGTSMTCK